MFRRRDLSVDRLKRTMEEHRDQVRERSSWLIKNSSEVVVSILKDEGERICLKQFCYPHVWDRIKEHFRRSKGHKSWVAAKRHADERYPDFKPLASGEKKLVGIGGKYFIHGGAGKRFGDGSICFKGVCKFK